MRKPQTDFLILTEGIPSGLNIAVYPKGYSNGRHDYRKVSSEIIA
jgi:hypothetical protein